MASSWLGDALRVTETMTVMVAVKVTVTGRDSDAQNYSYLDNDSNMPCKTWLDTLKRKFIARSFPSFQG